MKIDQEKLLNLIKEEVEEIISGYHIESSVVIGVIGNVQIQLVVTTDEDLKYENPSETYLCVEV